MALPVSLISPSVYSHAYNPYQWNSYNVLSPYHHGTTYMETSSHKVINIIRGRPEFGDTIAIHGPKRTGKTLLAIFIIIERLKESLSLYGDYIEKVLTNVELDLTSLGLQDKYEAFTDIEQIRNFVNGIIFLDETRRLADSYLSQSQQSRFTSNLLADTGKQKDDFYYTDQSPTGPPIRIRTNIDYVLAPQYDPYDTRWVANGEPGSVKVYVFDSLNAYNMFFNPFIPGQPMGKPIFQFAFYAPPFFKFYKTGQKIEDWHFKFKPDPLIEQFIDWRSKTWPSAPYGKKLIRLWDTVTGQDLSSPEREAILTTMDLKGLLESPPSDNDGEDS